MPGGSDWENKGSGNQLYGTVGESDMRTNPADASLNAWAPVVKESG